MKKIISAVLVLAFFAFTATAQNDRKDANADRGDRRQNYNRINPRLLDQLNLTATQSEQVKVINEDYRSKMQEMIKSELSVEDRKTRRSKFDTERRTKLLAILTPTQVQKLQELQKNERAGVNREVDYKSKTTDENGEKTKIKVKKDND